MYKKKIDSSLLKAPLGAVAAVVTRVCVYVCMDGIERGNRVKFVCVVVFYKKKSQNRILVWSVVYRPPLSGCFF